MKLLLSIEFKMNSKFRLRRKTIFSFIEWIKPIVSKKSSCFYWGHLSNWLKSWNEDERGRSFFLFILFIISRELFCLVWTLSRTRPLTREVEERTKQWFLFFHFFLKITVYFVARDGFYYIAYVYLNASNEDRE